MKAVRKEGALLLILKFFIHSINAQTWKKIGINLIDSNSLSHLLGKKVNVWVNEERNAGRLSSGIYAGKL